MSKEKQFLGKWVECPNTVLFWPDIPDTTLKLFIYLLKKQNKIKGYAWPSRDTISREIKLSCSTITRSLKWLKSNNLIEIKQGKTRFGLKPNNRYFINWKTINDSWTKSKPGTAEWSRVQKELWIAQETARGQKEPQPGVKKNRSQGSKRPLARGQKEPRVILITDFASASGSGSTGLDKTEKNIIGKSSSSSSQKKETNQKTELQPLRLLTDNILKQKEQQVDSLEIDIDPELFNLDLELKTETGQKQTEPVDTDQTHTDVLNSGAKHQNLELAVKQETISPRPQAPPAHLKPVNLPNIQTSASEPYSKEFHDVLNYAKTKVSKTFDEKKGVFWPVGSETWLGGLVNQHGYYICVKAIEKAIDIYKSENNNREYLSLTFTKQIVDRWVCNITDQTPLQKIQDKIIPIDVAQICKPEFRTEAKPLFLEIDAEWLKDPNIYKNDDLYKLCRSMGLRVWATWLKYRIGTEESELIKTIEKITIGFGSNLGVAKETFFEKTDIIDKYLLDSVIFKNWREDFKDFLTGA